MTTERPSLAVFTSGGDAPGMNAAVRAVVRTARHHEVDAYAVLEGYEGLVSGGDQIRPLSSTDVGGIVHQGGTVIGSARSKSFRERAGRRAAARNLIERGIDALVVIGGDGSLTGANIFRQEWPELCAELVDEGSLTQAQVDAHPDLRIVGIVGSIDNDMFGTDMTLGADTALHRIVEAIDAIHSTAASHQRTFVVEVMGRNCGYLALMAALATGANWVFIPESPPDVDDWAEAMCSSIAAGRRIGRRQNLVVLAEGARDRDGEPITAQQVKEAIEARLGEDTRITILGHVQRGGAPTPFDRNLGTLLGTAAVQEVMRLQPDEEAKLVGIKGNDLVISPLMECVERTQSVAEKIAKRDYAGAMELRGGSFDEAYTTLRTMVRAAPHRRSVEGRARRFAVLHAGGPAPGMNTAARDAVRLGMDRGHTVLAVQRGFEGLRDGRIRELDWMSVSTWVSAGGAELGTSRHEPTPGELELIAENLETHRIDGLLMIGGWAGYRGAATLHAARTTYEALDIPILCLPATINNDVPGTELSVGADSALNAITANVDRIKQSAVATHRCFVVEVMGNNCGYLALMAGLATGAERTYLPEDGITLEQLKADVDELTAAFAAGKRLGLLIRAENADPIYTTSFLRAVFENEGGGLYDVREARLGHLQQGATPSPFDRIFATRLASRCVDHLDEQMGRVAPASSFVGLVGAELVSTHLGRFEELVETDVQRPRHQPWRRLRGLARMMQA